LQINSRPIPRTTLDRSRIEAGDGEEAVKAVLPLLFPTTDLRAILLCEVLGDLLRHSQSDTAGSGLRQLRGKSAQIPVDPIEQQTEQQIYVLVTSWVCRRVELSLTGRFSRQGAQSPRGPSDEDAASIRRRNKDFLSTCGDSYVLVSMSNVRVLPFQCRYDTDAVSIWCK
jgi:hypothetical protein